MVVLRCICAALWILLALAFWIRSTGLRSTIRVWGVAACLLAAAASLARWHVALWQQTRTLLREAELYASRGILKLGIAVVLILLAALLLRVGWRLLRTPGRVGVVPIGASAWLIWLLAWTSFLDGVLPRVFGELPMRYGIEMAWSLTMIVLLARPVRNR